MGEGFPNSVRLNRRGALTQNLYLEAIKLTTATYTTAVANLVPAITFVMAVLFG